MIRRVEPEILDELPSTDPRAIRSRRDLRRVNAWMGNTRIMARALRSAFEGRRCETLVELGAGDGTYLLRVARRLAPDWSGVTVVLLDQQALVSPQTLRGFADLGWHAEPIVADVFDWLGQSGSRKCDALLANLFLHHFPEERLVGLLASAARRAPVFAAIDPRRWAWSLLGCRLLWLLGCTAVTRHDAVVSVRAGFAGQELSRLWPADRGWRMLERPANLSSHLFVAQWQL
jgi:hypothetical protein